MKPLRPSGVVQGQSPQQRDLHHDQDSFERRHGWPDGRDVDHSGTGSGDGEPGGALDGAGSEAHDCGRARGYKGGDDAVPGAPGLPAGTARLAREPFGDPHEDALLHQREDAGQLAGGPGTIEACVIDQGDAAPTVSEARRRLFDDLSAAGIGNASLEARWLVEHIAGEAAGCASRLSGEAVRRLADLTARRLAGEPFWRVIGEREFWGLPFRLSAATLEPRPDSETLVEAALQHLGERRNGRMSVLDLGTGTGCLLISVLSECPRATGLGIDLSEDACETARRNAEANGVSDRCAFRQGSWTDGLDQRFDLILSNPPYIPTADIEELDPGVRDHDPRLALDGGGDGLGPYRILAETLRDVLAPDGVVILEIGAGQEADVVGLMRDGGFVWRSSRDDLCGHPRALIFTAS